jgi:hypothetical protein
VKITKTVANKQLKAAREELASAIKPAAGSCTRCGGSGTYVWGGSINGVPMYSGTCYRCGGCGVEPVTEQYLDNIAERIIKLGLLLKENGIDAPLDDVRTMYRDAIEAKQFATMKY